jgi:hypothetical protein
MVTNFLVTKNIIILNEKESERGALVFSVWDNNSGQPAGAGDPDRKHAEVSIRSTINTAEVVDYIYFSS